MLSKIPLDCELDYETFTQESSQLTEEQPVKQNEEALGNLEDDYMNRFIGSSIEYFRFESNSIGMVGSFSNTCSPLV